MQRPVGVVILVTLFGVVPSWKARGEPMQQHTQGDGHGDDADGFVEQVGPFETLDSENGEDHRGQATWAEPRQEHDLGPTQALTRRSP